MIKKVFRTHDVPREDRFDLWRELVSHTHAPLQLESEHSADFQASQEVLTLGDVTIWPTTFTPVRYVRTAKLVRASDPETVHVSLPIRGTLRGSHGNHEKTCGPGTFCVLDTSRPISLMSGDGDHPHTGIGLEIPKVLLPPTRRHMASLTSMHFTEQEGFGTLLGQLMRSVAWDTGTYGPADAERLGTIAADLLSAMFAHALEAERSLAPETHKRTLILRIRAFIRQNLNDPLLTPSMVAAVHHISLSYLHRLFQGEDLTVAAWIRHQRLERARRDLTDPALHHETIHQIAARWGFSRAADFTRAFRTHYGIPPRDCRHRAFGLQVKTHC
ncbi:helix-turn-helix domain-containing protein [Streptomyces sp. NPDC048611]|uniref:AraC-like ligand-binding domain-containing protein n=1 Tax=unclassified Streptomyces TaxID=2593676 RepID=UPI003426C49B